MRIHHKRVRRKRRALKALKVFLWVCEVVHTLAVAAEMAALPYRVAFGMQAPLYWEFLLEALFIAEIVINRSLQIKLGAEIMEIEAKNYSSSRALFDIATLFPLHSFLCFLSRASVRGRALQTAGFLQSWWPLFQLFRIPQGSRVVQKYWTLAVQPILRLFGVDFDTHTGTVKLVGLLVAILFTCHLLSTMYIYIVRIEGFPANAWATQISCPDGRDGDCNFFALCYEEDRRLCYMRSLFWAFSSITGGLSYDPESEIEIIFSTFTMFVGVSLNMITFASIANIIAEMEEERQLYARKQQSVTEFSRSFKLSPSLESRLQRFVRLNFQLNNARTNMQELLKELPYQLRKDVCRDLFRSIINGVALFKHTEKHFLDALATKFTSIVIPAGEYVFHQGDLGDQMYFIADGECAVIIDSKQVSEGVLQSAEPTSPADTRLRSLQGDYA